MVSDVLFISRRILLLVSLIFSCVGSQAMVIDSEDSEDSEDGFGSIDYPDTPATSELDEEEEYVVDFVFFKEQPTRKRYLSNQPEPRPTKERRLTRAVEVNDITNYIIRADLIQRKGSKVRLKYGARKTLKTLFPGFTQRELTVAIDNAKDFKRLEL